VNTSGRCSVATRRANVAGSTTLLSKTGKLMGSDSNLVNSVIFRA